MREINWKKLVGAASAAVLAATQVAPAITAYAEEAGTTDYVYCAASLTWAEYWENEGVYLDSAADGNWEASSADSGSDRNHFFIICHDASGRRRCCYLYV